METQKTNESCLPQTKPQWMEWMDVCTELSHEKIRCSIFSQMLFLGFLIWCFAIEKLWKIPKTLWTLKHCHLKAINHLDSEVAPNVIFDSVLSDNLNGSIPINYKVLHQAKKINGNCKIFHAEYLVEEKESFCDFRASECYLAHYPNCVQSFIFDWKMLYISYTMYLFRRK